LKHEPLKLKIAKKKSGAYELQRFSIKKMRNLNEYHNQNAGIKRTWKLSQDQQVLEIY